MLSDPEQGQSEPSEFFQSFCEHHATPALVTSRCLHTSTTSSASTPHTYLRLLFHDYSEAFNTIKAYRESPDLQILGSPHRHSQHRRPSGLCSQPALLLSHSDVTVWPRTPSWFIRSLTRKSGPDLDASDPHHHWNSYTAALLPPQAEETWTPGSTTESVLTGCITTWYNSCCSLNRSPQHIHQRTS